MTLTDFQKRFKKTYGYEIILYYIVCIAVIVFGLIMFYKIGIEKSFHVIGNQTFGLVLFSLFIPLGLFGLKALNSRYKLTYIPNNLTKNENVLLVNDIFSELFGCNENSNKEYRYYIYKKHWWNMPYEINIFADDNLLVLNVESIDYNGGFIDFGASDRLKKKIIILINKRIEQRKIK